MYKILSSLLFVSFLIPLNIHASDKNNVKENEKIPKFTPLPLELKMEVIDFLNFNDILNFRPVSKYNFNLSKLWQGKIDASKSYKSNGKRKTRNIDFERLKKILQHFTNITSLSILGNNIQKHLKELISPSTTKDENRTYGYENFYLSQNLSTLNLFNCGITDSSFVSLFFKQNYKHPLTLGIRENDFESFRKEFWLFSFSSCSRNQSL